MRRIAIDVREACRERVTGKGRWTKGLVDELLSRDAHPVLITDKKLPAAWSNGDELLISGSGLGWHLQAAKAIERSSVAAYLSTTSYIIPCLLKRTPCVTTVHDLIAFRSEPHDRKATLIERLTLGRALKRSAAVLTISDATKADLLARFPQLNASKVTSIYAGLGMPASASRRPDGRTILCVGTLCPRKNQLRLIRAFASLPSPLRETSRLVLAGGRGWDDQEIIDAARTTPGVEWIDYVPDDKLEELFAACVCMALPSHYEGFGLPVLDAMTRGIPVLTSSRASLAEVAGDSALIVDPDDEADIARGLETLLRDTALQEELAKKGLEQAKKYSWSRTVDLLELALNRIDNDTMKSAR
jgi:glycosyltransferase involved in cell wall biosynthesis